MATYRTGTITVTNGSKAVTGVSTLFKTAGVVSGDQLYIVDANNIPTGYLYEVDVVDSDTLITLKQNYQGTTASGQSYMIMNMAGNQTVPNFASRLAPIMQSWSDVTENINTTPQINGIPQAGETGKIDKGWLPDATAEAKGVVKVGSNISVAEGVISVPEATEAVKGVDWRRVPIGSILIFPIATVPAHCLECNGAEVSRATYAGLFEVIGTTYGEGDGSTTFNIPDLRGEFIRGWDNSRGADTSRAIGTLQTDSFASHKHETEAIYPGTMGNSGMIPYAGATGTVASISTTLVGGTETRPRNVAMMYCIVYE